jgi:hypothetical protein
MTVSPKIRTNGEIGHKLATDTSTRELSVQLLCRFPIRRSGLFCGVVESSKILAPEARPIFLASVMECHAAKTDLAVWSRTAISKVLRRRRWPEVAPPVIRLNTVDMVDLIRRPRVGHVEERKPMRLVPPTRDENPEIAVLGLGTALEGTGLPPAARDQPSE